MQTNVKMHLLMLYAKYVFVCSLFGLAGLSAQEIKITSGISDEQVLQRNPHQAADVHLTGTVTGKKTNGKAIEVRITSASNVLSNFDWVPAGKVQKLNWTADLIGIPTGGPYRMEVRMQGGNSVAVVDNILVGDLWVLAGQSNMEGVADLIDVQQPDPLVHSFDLADRWGVAEEPLHTLVSAVDRVHWRNNAQGEPERWTAERLQRYIQERRKGAGLGVPFAIEMLKRTGIPVGLIPCAHGGTSMEQWSPSLKDKEGDSLYGSMLRRVKVTGGHVRGVLWYQGESDANPKAAPAFLERFESFVRAVRADFDDPDLPFYYVQIGRHVNDSNVSEWNLVQEAQRKAETRIPHSGMVVAVDSTLDDGIHVSTQDQKRLGRRLADRVCHDLFPRLKNYGELKLGPRPVAAKYANGMVKVEFSGVNGRLQSEGRISGFSIHAADGKPVPLIYKARVDPAEASTVRLYVGGKLPEKATLRYGYGKDPYCNLHDANDSAVPVFGPMEIQ
jgi:sialate O-acetylesterase